MPDVIIITAPVTMNFLNQLFCSHNWQEIKAKASSILLGTRIVHALECTKCYKIIER